MRGKWDEGKNRKLQADPRRKLGFEEVRVIFNNPYYLDQKNDEPEQ